MRRSMGIIILLLLMFSVFTVFAYAEGDLTQANRLAHRNAARYDISAPAWSDGDPTWTVQAKYTPDPDNANAMLLDLLIRDQDGRTPDTRNIMTYIFVPYPEGHDAAMGYNYKIEKVNTGTECERSASIDPAIAFQPDWRSPNGLYRISWDKMTPKAAAWGLVMSKMDWSGNSCRYTVGAGNKKISVTRQGDEITISGGEIYDGIQFVQVLDGVEDYEQLLGWHTESGSYTFHNVTLQGITVQAHDGEHYKITLDASVKGNYSMYCELRNGANLELINNDIIRSDYDYSLRIFADTTSSMTITGNGKILTGNGYLFVEELNGDILDEVPIYIALTTKNARNNAEAIEEIKDFEGRVVISHDQIKTANGFPAIRSYCDYSIPEYGEEMVIDPQTGKRYAIDTDYVVKKLRPAKGVMTEPILSDASDLDEGALFRPLLVSNENGEHYLRSEITQEVKGESVHYEIHIVDDEDAALSLSQSSSLYIPYPEGMDMQSAAEKEITIRHITSSGAEVFSTKDGTIELTPYGLCITASSLSPFEVSWTASEPVTQPDELPQTGDPTPLALCALLLVLSLSAAIVLTRKVERQ